MNQELLDYIKKAKEARQSDEQIKEGLLKAGWKDADISEVLSSASKASKTEEQTSPKMIMWVGLFSILLNSIFISYISGFLTLEGVQFQISWNWIAALDHYDYLSLILIPVSILLFFITPVLGIIYGYKLLAGGKIKNYAISYLIATPLLMAGFLFLGQFTFFLYYIVIAIVAFLIFPELRQRSYVISSQIDVGKRRKFFTIALVTGVILGILSFSVLVYKAKQAQINENFGNENQVQPSEGLKSAKGFISLNDPRYPAIKEFVCEDGGVLRTTDRSNVYLRQLGELAGVRTIDEGSPGEININFEFVLHNDYASGTDTNEDVITYIKKCKNEQGKSFLDFYPLAQ